MTIEESVALTALRRRYDVLKLFAESFAECEECRELEECLPECTFKEDCDNASDTRRYRTLADYRRMLDARLALYGALE